MLAIPRDTDFVEARRLIDEECHNYEKRILSLKMQRNTFTSIAKIPDEVLLQIFMILKDTHGSELSLHVTHVCVHWRWVATQAPQLWTTPPTYNHDFTLLFLKRSAPLALDVAFDAKTSRDTAFAVLRNIQRIQVLSFSGLVSHDFFTQMQEFLLRFGHEAPMLKVLNIALLPSHRLSQRCKLSASTFGCPLLLQSLCLQCIDFDWTMLPLPNLTTLSLIFMQMSSALPWETFFRILAAMPLLKTLSLQFDILQLRPLPSTINPIWLPHLVTLQIMGASAAEILQFLSATMMPSLEQMTIDYTVEDYDDHSWIIPPILSTIEQGDFGTLDDLDVCDGSVSLYSSSQKSSKYLHYYHLGWLTMDTAAQFMNELFSGMSTLAADGKLFLTSATVGLFSEPTTRIFEPFSALPSLESMTLIDEMTIPFLNSLSIPTSAVEKAQLPFPNLKSIVFEVNDYIDPDQKIVFDDELSDLLLDCMTQRCDDNAPIATLSIPWVITQEQAQSLMAVVVDLKFDRSGGIQK